LSGCVGGQRRPENGLNGWDGVSWDGVTNKAA